MVNKTTNWRFVLICCNCQWITYSRCKISWWS